MSWVVVFGFKGSRASAVYISPYRNLISLFKVSPSKFYLKRKMKPVLIRYEVLMLRA